LEEPTTTPWLLMPLPELAVPFKEGSSVIS
jgi:hypothetical protein